jgi:hypothetical protein
VAARRIGLPPPADRAALNIPVNRFLVPVQANTLVGKVVKQSRKGFTSIFKFRLERQQAESQVCQAKFRAKLAQTIFQTGAPDPHDQTTTGSRPVSLFKANLQLTYMLERKM